MMENLKEFAAYMIGVGQKDKTIEIKNVKPTDGEPFAVIQEGMKIESLKKHIPARPDRIREALAFYDVKSFIEYVNEFKTTQTRLFASLQKAPYTVTAIFDYHSNSSRSKSSGKETKESEAVPRSADWCTHSATLTLGLTDEFSAWSAKDGTFFKQQDFADFLKDNRIAITEPSNAEILMLVQELEVTAQSKCNSKLRTNEGIAFAFEENYSTKTQGQNISVPEQISLMLPMFIGMDSIKITADFKFRLNGGELTFSYKMLEMRKMLQEVVSAVKEQIQKDVELPVYLGAPLK